MQTEKRLIYADDAKRAIEHYDPAFSYVIDNVPTVEVVHSQWDTVFYERNGTLASYSHICPKCKYFYRDLRFEGHNYCPNCGVNMMDGEKDNAQEIH